MGLHLLEAVDCAVSDECQVIPEIVIEPVEGEYVLSQYFMLQGIEPECVNEPSAEL
jgi:hypothetical protein